MNNKANVLIVDDEEVVRLSHLRSLQGADCNARTAEDGRSCCSICVCPAWTEWTY